MPNYLLAAAPVPGHVAPMTQIGKDLVRRGHRVRMLSGEEFTETIRAAGIDPVALAPECHIAPPAAKAHRARVTGPVDRWRRGRTELRELFVEPMAAQHRSLHRALRTGPVDAVLVDVAFTGVLPTLLAGAPRPPVLACGVVPLMLSSVDTPPFGMGRPPTRRRDYPAMGWVVHRLLFGPTQALADRQLRALGRPRLPVFLIDWPKLADRLLQLTVPSFEYPRRDLPPTVTFAGPVLPEPPPKTALPASWPELAGSRPVIHVAQGTWDNTDLDRLIGPALRALATEDALVVATTGGPPAGELPAPLPANTRVAEFLPYQWLLPQVDVMVTNGGYGGVQCALAHGVPLVVAGVPPTSRRSPPASPTPAPASTCAPARRPSTPWPPRYAPCCTPPPTGNRRGAWPAISPQAVPWTPSRTP